MLHRNTIEARYGFEMRGITKEVCFSDMPSSEYAKLIEIEIEEDRDDKGDDFASTQSEWHRQQELLPEALKGLTDRQVIALYLYLQKMPEREAADYMGISQPTYREIIHGKNGIGGALKKLRKFYESHPIA